MSKASSTTTSFPIAGILGVVFVTLKLLHKIDWSWWWVTAPFWMPFVAFLLVISIVGVFVVFATAFDK